MAAFSYLFVFVLGSCVGSFLNCVIYWLENKKRKNLWGRSFCPRCGHRLAFWDLIPIFSFLFLKRKCRYCGWKISFQYPFVEIAAGILFVLIFWHSGFGFDLIFKIWILDFLYLAIIASLLIIVFVYDLKHYLIPDKLIYLAIGIVILFGIWDLGFNRLSGFGHWGFSYLINPVCSAIGAAGFFFLIWALSKGKWMGFGDVQLAFFMGLFLGWPRIVVALFSSFLVGAIIGIGSVCLARKSIKSQIPFGPFLIGGTFIALFWGRQIIGWYLNFLR